MEITEEKYFTRLLRLLHHQLGVVVDRVELRTRPNPLSVQILSHQRAPIVTHDDAIRIEHRYDLEHVRVSEKLRFRIITHQEVDTSFHHV